MRILIMTGILDVVVNNIDEPAMLYENKSADNKSKAFVEIKLKGPSQNINAIGSKSNLICKWWYPHL